MSLFSNFVPFKDQLERYVESSRQIFEEVGDTASAKLVDGFIRDLDRQRYNITIVGSFNRGKSTLLNVLMERSNDEISPIACTACTSAIIKYLDKGLLPGPVEEECAKVYFNDPNKDPQDIPLSRIRDFVTEERNQKNSKDVRSIEVFGEFPTWSRAVTIVDTPGQNTVYAHHDALLTDFLPYTDAIIFLVAADLPFDGGDIALLKALSEKQKKEVFFVLSKLDEIRPGDRKETVDYVSRIIAENGYDSSRLYCVSAKPVFEALMRGVRGEELANLKSMNGIANLEADLERFVVMNSDVTKVMKSRIEMVLNSVRNAGERYIKDTEVLLESKDLDLAELKAQELSLDADAGRLRNGLDESLAEFKRSWARSVRTCGRKVADKAEQIDASINDEINKKGLAGAVFQAFSLKQLVATTVDRDLRPIFTDLQVELEGYLQKLDKDCQDEINVFAKKASQGVDGASTIGGIVTSTVLGSAVVGGTALSVGAFASVGTSWAAYLAAQAANKTVVIGFFPKVWAWLAGSGTASKTALDLALTGSALTKAIASAIMTFGMSIAVTLLLSAIAKIGLKAFMSGRAPKLIAGMVDDVSRKLTEGLERVQDDLIDKYRETVETAIEAKTKKLAEIRAILDKADPNERKQLEERVGRMKMLLSDGAAIPVNAVLTCK